MPPSFFATISVSFSLFFCISTFAETKPDIPPEHSPKEAVSLTTKELAGKTVTLDYSSAVYYKNWACWRPAKESGIPLEQEIKFAHDSSMTIPAWYDLSKKIKLLCRQVTDGFFIFHDGREKGETDSYYMIFLSPDSGIAYRMAARSSEACSDKNYLITNIKFTLKNQPGTNGKNPPDNHLVSKESVHYAPDKLEGKKIVFGAPISFICAQMHGEGFSILEEHKKFRPVVFINGKGYAPRYINPYGGDAEEVYYSKTGPDAAVISLFNPAEVNECDQKGEQVVLEEYETELQLVFTAPNKGYLVFIMNFMTGISYHIGFSFKIADLTDQEKKTLLEKSPPHL